MTQVGAPPHEPIPIGEVASPPFVRLPDPRGVFAARAARFHAHAQTHGLRPFLLFLAGVSGAQHAILERLPPVDPPSADVLERAREHAMPPLDRSHFAPDPVFEQTLADLLAGVDGVAMPDPARAALSRTAAADPVTRTAMVQAVFADAVPVEALAEHVFVAAALQVHFSRLAATLDPARLVPVADGVCPVCGGAPVSSLVVGWSGAHGTRFCACSLCATLWNYVRIKCTVCGSSKGISYEEIDGGPGTIKAETCTACRSYVKVLYQVNDAALDPVADDVASLALDLMVREAGFRRAAVNPFLFGY